MEEKLQELVEKGLSNVKIGDELGIHRTTVPKWMNKYGIIRKAKKKNTNCSLCDKFLGDNDRNRSKCQSCTTRIRRYRLKKKAVEYKGGCCVKCGYNNSLSALEFHHINKDDKDFGISEMNHKSWVFIKGELDKCVLLCSNCHREEHSKYEDEEFLVLINQLEV